MNNKNGLTLIEVIVSLAVLGIISVAFLGAMTAHFSYLKSTVGITQNDFKAQELMENEIDEAKVRVADPDASLSSVEIFKEDLGGITVEYEEINISHNNKEYYTLVSNVRPDPLEIINLESIGIKLFQNSSQIQDDYYAYPNSSFSIIGNFENKNTHKWDHLLNQVEWYISTDKYNIPLPKGGQSVDLNDDEYHYYPLFPRDYEILSNETIYKFGASQSIFSDMSQLAGRFLVYAVTPAAKSGKLGNQLVSKPIFISGLPVTDNIITHLDASYIDTLTNNSESERQSGSDLLKVWYDISSIVGRNSPNESAVSPNTNSFRPFVLRSDVNDDFIGQLVRFDTNRYVQLNQGVSGETVTIFIVAKNRDSIVSKIFVNGRNEILLDPPTVDSSEQWNIIRSQFVLDGSNMVIGNSLTDVTEVLVYSGTMSFENNEKVLQYLNDKYFSGNVIIN
ncbi:prepilin-type N-terminal cleavage/methylation domain-containing protein [Proteiniclasticum ruminis]|uniref:prepilin-type N-terminal cleavage/methylation domain-containing protein n=1 Tax=Proteiniclasticum ruminis TaxID=398199 RepID=UPI0028AF5EDF|nr:prepilin-type N-terminal cleavage/methylation domain-containing protein [Proteiniclasticum ruminis]